MPLGWLYGLGGRLKGLVTRTDKAKLPVICIGNFVAGGAGKTPVALALAGLLHAHGKSVGFLTRGYGGNLTGPVFVKPNEHDTTAVGDEALLLAAHHPTVLAANRYAGACKFSSADTDVIVMDDGFQNPTLHKDLCLIVIDHRQGIGNGCLIPAGPLREGVDYQISKAHGFIIIGGELVDQNLKQRLQKSGKPIFTSQLERGPTAPDLTGRQVIAYTGIAMPEKFFATLEKAGAKITEQIRFPDHHPFSQSDAQWLLSLQADNSPCLLVTTAKDHIRLKQTDKACGKLYLDTLPYEVTLKFDHEQALADFITTVV